MHLFQAGVKTTVFAPAKLNLFFEVLAKRTDGFHEIETLAYPIDLYDTVEFENREDGTIRFHCDVDARLLAEQSAEASDIPVDSRNLAYRAVELLRMRAGVRQGASIRLRKRIPSQAGLGGGSSDAAAALAAANHGWGLHWSQDELRTLGAELGSDVPLFFVSGASIGRGRGERISPVGPIGTLHFVLVRPPTGLATAEVYGACKTSGARRSPQLDSLVLALRRGNIAEGGRLMFNRLEEPAAALTPWIEDVCGRLAREGCSASRMTGSGSCCFGLCRHARHARRVAQRLGASGPFRTWTVRGSC